MRCSRIISSRRDNASLMGQFYQLVLFYLSLPTVVFALSETTSFFFIRSRSAAALLFIEGLSRRASRFLHAKGRRGSTRVRDKTTQHSARYASALGSTFATSSMSAFYVAACRNTATHRKLSQDRVRLTLAYIRQESAERLQSQFILRAEVSQDQPTTRVAPESTSPLAPTTP